MVSVSFLLSREEQFYLTILYHWTFAKLLNLVSTKRAFLTIVNASPSLQKLKPLTVVVPISQRLSNTTPTTLASPPAPLLVPLSALRTFLGICKIRVKSFVTLRFSKVLIDRCLGILIT